MRHASALLGLSVLLVAACSAGDREVTGAGPAPSAGLGASAAVSSDRSPGASVTTGPSAPQPGSPVPAASGRPGGATGTQASPTVPGGTASRPPRVPPPAPRPSGEPQLRRRDDGTTLTIPAGSFFSVRLDEDWTAPATPAGGVLRRTSAQGGAGTGQRLRAVFRATSPGRVTLMTTTDYTCLHTSPPCARSQQSWKVTVVVTR